MQLNISTEFLPGARRLFHLHSRHWRRVAKTSAVSVEPVPCRHLLCFVQQLFERKRAAADTSGCRAFRDGLSNEGNVQAVGRGVGSFHGHVDAKLLYMRVCAGARSVGGETAQRGRA